MSVWIQCCLQWQTFGCRMKNCRQQAAHLQLLEVFNFTMSCCCGEKQLVLCKTEASSFLMDEVIETTKRVCLVAPLGFSSFCHPCSHSEMVCCPQNYASSSSSMKCKKRLNNTVLMEKPGARLGGDLSLLNSTPVMSVADSYAQTSTLILTMGCFLVTTSCFHLCGWRRTK